MRENNNIKLTSISKAETYDEIAEFWDSHSLSDYWEQTHEVEFEIRAKRRHRITIDAEIYKQIEMVARIRGILPETLVNIGLVEWLQRGGLTSYKDNDNGRISV